MGGSLPGFIALTYMRCDTQLTTRQIAPYAFEKSKGLGPARTKDEFDLAEKRPTHLVSSAHRGSIVFPAFAYFVYYFVSIFLHFE